RETATRRRLNTRVGEGRDCEILGLLAEQDGKPRSRVHARSLAFLRELVVHRAGHVDEESGRARKLFESGDALEHGVFERVLELRSVTNCRYEPERQRSRDALV